MSTMSPQARQELVTAVAERYQRSTPAERGRLLDEFVALTGYHRKHSIRVLNGSSAVPAVRRGRRSVYDEAVTEGLVVLWEASDRVCGKRLKALLPTLVPALERHGHVTLDPRVREQLMAVSAATIDRRLASARAVTAGQRRRRRSGGDRVRGRVPVRTFGDWQDPAPGFVEAISSRTVDRRWLAASSGRWCWPISPAAGRNAYRCSCVQQASWSTRWIGSAAPSRFRCGGSTPTTAASFSTRC